MDDESIGAKETVDAGSRVIAAIACDLERSPIGTQSRLEKVLGGKSVLRRTVERVAAVASVERVVLMAAAGQEGQVKEMVGGIEKVVIETLVRRSEALERRVRAARAWGLMAWRGGAGQWTVFDEDYHPQSVWAAVEKYGGGENGHVLTAAAHAGLVDTELLAGLVRHHFKNHEMRVTYSPAAPGLCGMVLQGGIAKEMAGANVLPGQLLAYDPKAPTFDTLIRDACMQVDPALSKVANRFLLDNERSWRVGEKLDGREFGSAADMALAARQVRAEVARQPVEVEIELTGEKTQNAKRKTQNGQAVRGALGSGHWVKWLGRQEFLDDLTVSFAGDGDPLFYGELPAVLAAAREAGVRNIHVQTDLIEGTERLWAAMEAGSVDVVSVQFYGDSAETYKKVSGIDGYATVMGNMEELLRRGGERGAIVVPRLLKVRETIPEMEGFFDKWVLRCGWAVMDGPTDKAGSEEFRGVVDMAPPKRRACRRIGAGEGRFVIRCDGTAVACDQDVKGALGLGHIEGMNLEEMWMGGGGEGMGKLRVLHDAGEWGKVVPCQTCREWHRA